MKVTTYNREQTLKVSAGGHEPLKRGEWNWPAKKLPFHTMDVSDAVTQDALMPDDTSAELARLLVEIGWSQRELARRLNVTESTTRSWASGRRECHFTVLEWLRGIQVQP